MLVVIPSDLCVTEELPSIYDILKLCMSLHTMRIVCNHCFMCCWEKHWKMQIQAGKKVNDITTISDAFMLLILKNIWDDMMSGKIKVHYWPKKCKKCCNDAESSEGSKNTDSPNKMINEDDKHGTTMVITGQWTSAWHGSHWYGGWSPEGLNHFNQLVVKQDRENNKH